MSVSFELDDYIRDLDKTYWSALLSNGRWVYQDDGRPGETEPRAWVRLRDYCHANDLYVVQMRLRFRSHEETMPPSSEGYFCRNRILGTFSDDKAKTQAGYVLGPVRDGKIYVQTWIAPELIPDEHHFESVRDIEGHEDSIIWNKNGNTYLQTLVKYADHHTT